MTSGAADGNQRKQAAPASGLVIHLATRATDGSGAVIKGMEIDETDATNRRENGEDVVVCGDDATANRQMAMKIEDSVGPWMRQQKHNWSAGPMALPHFQQRIPPPHGHTFYETANAKARKAK